MIVTTDIADILYRDCQELFVPITKHLESAGKFIPANGRLLASTVNAYGEHIANVSTELIPFGKTFTGELKEERIIIHVKGQTPSKYWEKCFVEVNLCVPDLGLNIANTIRLKTLERLAKKHFRSLSGEYDGTRYHYEIDTIHIEADTALKCHFVNCRILFNALNVK